ncbi:MAG TPA: hypothetical protein VFE34_03285 [Dongiaceae bacterium]|jgi:hypothetical protein|nr:hypothetical protein [Dongiaceae bacterium]
MVEFRTKIPKSHRGRFRRFLEWISAEGVENPGPSDLRPEQLERYANTLLGEKVGTQGAYLIGAVRGAQIVAPWLNLGGIRRQAQDLVNAGRDRKKKGRSPNQGIVAELSVPLDRWPAENRKAWKKALGAMQEMCGEVEGVNPFMHYAEADVVAFSRNRGTRRNHQHAWGRWLYVMRRANQDWEISPTRIETFIRACLSEGCSHGGIASYLSSIAFMVPIVAPKTSRADVKILKDTRTKEIERHGVTKSPEIAHPSKLIHAGLELMERAERSVVSSRSAIEYRDGLLLAVGTIIAARGINLGSLRLGHDIFLDDDPRIVWEAVSIKGRVGHTYPLPEELFEPMRRFADRYRGMLMGADVDSQDWFWAPRRGGSGENRGLTPSAINRIVTKRSMELIKDEDGNPIRMTGHPRRNAVATMFAEEAPEHVGNVSLLLQQADPRSRKIYSKKARKVMAAKVATERLAELRKALNLRAVRARSLPRAPRNPGRKPARRTRRWLSD